MGTTNTIARPTDNESASTTEWDDVIVDLYTNHFESLVGSARRYLHQREAAEEAVQDAFVHFHRANAVEVAETPIAYLRTIVVNNARTMVRRQACRDRHRPTSLPFASSVEDGLIALEQAAALRDACNKLPERQRAVLTLRYWRDLSEAEIANELGISTGSVKTHASRGRVALREALASTAA